MLVALALAVANAVGAPDVARAAQPSRATQPTRATPMAQAAPSTQAAQPTGAVQAAGISPSASQYIVFWRGTVAQPVEGSEVVAATVHGTPGDLRTVVRPAVGEATALVERLRANPAVRAIVPDTRIAIDDWPASGPPNDAFYAADQHDLPLMDVPAAWHTTVGDPSVVVAVLDTGFTPGHEDLSGVSLVAPFNEITGTTDATDDHGHGTHVTGTIAAVANNRSGVAGIAPGVSIMPVKVLDGSGEGELSWLLDGIDYAVAHGARIINLSLGGSLTPADAAAVQPVFTAAYASGVTIFAAVGNDGNSSIEYPAGFNHVIGVAASNAFDGHAPFSNVNASVDVDAPGVGILSTFPFGCAQAPSCYLFLQGTSMATPHAAAAGALVLSAHPADTPDDLAAALENTAVDLGSPGRDNQFGYGRIDAGAAVAYGAGGSVPTITIGSPATGTTTITGTTVAEVDWTETGSIVSRLVAQQVGRPVRAGTCAGATWLTSPAAGSGPSPFLASGLSAGSCYRWSVTISDGTSSAVATSGAILVRGPISIAWRAPRPGATIRQRARSITLKLTIGGPVRSRRLVQQWARPSSRSTCTGVTWHTSWTHAGPVSTQRITGLIAGRCYRWTETVISVDGSSLARRSGVVRILH